MVTTETGFAAAQAYGMARGVDLTLNQLRDLVRSERPEFHNLLDLGNGLFASPDDVVVGIQGIAHRHGGTATMREVLEEEFTAIDRPPMMFDGEEAIVGDPDVFDGPKEGDVDDMEDEDWDGGPDQPESSGSADWDDTDGDDREDD